MLTDKDTLIPATPSAQAYQDEGLERPPVPDIDEPYALFAQWLQEAKAREPNDANAMALATVDGAGMPDVRIVLLKDVSEGGFTFYTNTMSAKGLALADRPVAALNFHWKTLRRQVRVRGHVGPVSPQEADAYFATRARDSQIGAWASAQSDVMADRMTLEARIGLIEALHEGEAVPRPGHWSGYRVAPVSVEFWQDRPFRLHDRLRLRRLPDGSWARDRLYP